MPSLNEIRISALTLAAGAIGALVAFLLHFPAPFLTGPAIFVTCAGLFGFKTGIPNSLKNVCFIVIGVSMGSGVSPEVLQTAKSWPLSFIMMFVNVLAVYAVAYLILRRLFGYDETTSKLAAAPGHLSFVLGLGADTRADLASVVIVQSIRVLALTLMVPLIVAIMHLESTSQPVFRQSLGLITLAVCFALSFLTGKLFIRLKVPAAYLLGGFAISAAGHFSGEIAGAVPQWLAIPAYVAMGSLIGSRFSGVSMGMLRSAVVAGVFVTLAVVVVSAVTAMFVSSATGLPINATLIAFAPGGVETMAAMAILMGADTTYVGAHHVLRLLFLTVILPATIRRRAERP